MSELRRELPELPPAMRGLPIDERGYPVPWFVAWLDAAGEPCAAGDGKPDFRIIRPGGVADAHGGRTCWLCGGRLGAHKTFVIGPMCAVNRTSAEPPSHPDCGDFAARACPFLARPHARRRDAGKPEAAVAPAGVMLERNPGVALVWTTKRYTLRRAPNGVLFDIGSPLEVKWYCEGRAATRDEVWASIESGLPLLREYAKRDRGGLTALAIQVGQAKRLLPA